MLPDSYLIKAAKSSSRTVFFPLQISLNKENQFV